MYTIQRDYRGNLKGEMVVAIGGGKTLEIRANKTSNGEVVCRAVAGVLENCVSSDGKIRYQTFQYAPFSDFSCRIGQPVKRCTEKNVRALMDQAVAELNRIVGAARNFYQISEVN